MVTEYFDDIVYQFLYDQYPIYRNNLVDPNELPDPLKITWREPETQTNPTSFNVKELATNPGYKHLGSTLVEYVTTCTVRIGLTWTQAGKPPYLNPFRKFLQMTVNKNQINQYFRDRGIHHIQEGSSAAVEPPNPEIDQWILNFNIHVYQLLDYG